MILYPLYYLTRHDNVLILNDFIKSTRTFGCTVWNRIKQPNETKRHQLSCHIETNRYTKHTLGILDETGRNDERRLSTDTARRNWPLK